MQGLVCARPVQRAATAKASSTQMCACRHGLALHSAAVSNPVKRAALLLGQTITCSAIALLLCSHKAAKRHTELRFCGFLRPPMLTA